MKNELQIFKYHSAEVRTVTQKDGTWWVLKDVCDILEIGNSRDVTARLDDDEKGVDIIDTLGGKQEFTIISESGLYNVILLSRKPEAKKFKRWVTHEVLPTIRKHGAYMTTEKLEEVMNDPDAWIKVLTALKEERAQKQQLETELDYSKEWFSIKRVAKMNGVDWRTFDWRKLKDESIRQGFHVKKIFDANYGEVNTYHCAVWEKAYPRYEV